MTDVILVGHSYGGMVITGVADQALERVSELVYLDAAIPLSGDTLVSISPAVKDMAKRESRLENGVELFLWPGSAIAREIFGITAPADLAWMESKLTPHPWKTFEQPVVLDYPDKVAQISRTIINCTSTLKRRAEKTRDRYFEADRVWEVDAAHDLMITQPELLAHMLLRLTCLEKKL